MIKLGMFLLSFHSMNNLPTIFSELIVVIKDVGSVTTSKNSTFIKGRFKTDHDVIPFICWGEDIPQKEPFLKPGIKCDIENIYIKPYDRNYDRSSTVDWQCTLMANTKITWISRVDAATVITETVFQKCELEEICKFEGSVGKSVYYNIV